MCDPGREIDRIVDSFGFSTGPDNNEITRDKLKNKEREAKEKADAAAARAEAEAQEAQDTADTLAADKIAQRKRRIRRGGGQSTVHTPLGSPAGIDQYLG